MADPVGGDQVAAGEATAAAAAKAVGEERRDFTAQALRVEARADGGSRLAGHAAVFNQAANIADLFMEEVAPGAFARAIREDDPRALAYHNIDQVLGRVSAGTLRLSEDSTGLAVDIDLPDTQVARDLAVSIGRGDVTGMSFSFEAIRQEWQSRGEGQLPLRRLLEVRLLEVSPVAFPAYPGTDIALRCLRAARGDATAAVGDARPAVDRRRLLLRHRHQVQALRLE